ncbi:hypothetical protein BD779DRAFT_1673477 [Infundibulicybe gibba]|nr:hypothetical protein BD779DRAFT_1673477 [Infundibulicybe gibba]
MELISTHSQQLLDLSSSLDTWQGSKYGKFLRLCTQHTLRELQSHWKGYLETAGASPAAKKRLYNTFANGMRQVLADKRFINQALRAAGPLWQSVGSLGENLYNHFWTNGVTNSRAAVPSKSLHANPLFAYSLVGKGFDAHYGTEPVSSFHLAIPLASSSSQTADPQDLGDFARSEFGTWCNAFADHVKRGKITIRFFAGDALAFPHALHYYSRTGDSESHVYTSGWSGCLINFNGEDYSDAGNAPRTFNVIDTSNLSDHISMLNLLIACLPLLHVSASATLQTNTLHPLQDDSNTSLDRLCGDFSALSSILGITSKAHVSEFATHFSGSEPMIGSQLHERISWKWTKFIGSTMIPSARCDIALEFDAKQLATFLFNIYLQMFTEESKTTAQVTELRYTRSSFSFLLVAVMSRTHQDWTVVMGHFMTLIESDRKLLLGMTHYQDLVCCLHLHGIYTIDSIRDPRCRGPRADLSMFKNYPIIPPLTCIVFRIPRERVKILEAIDIDVIGTPILYCEVKGPGFSNMFAALQMVLGNIDTTRTDGIIVMNEDPLGWLGDSPLVVSFWMPSWMLTIDPSRTRILLSVRPTMDAIANLMPKLGLEMSIFAAPLQDRKHIFISPQRPSNGRELECYQRLLPSRDISSMVMAKVALDSAAQNVSTFTIRKDVVDDAARKSLSSRAAVTTTPISPCALRVAIGSHKMIFSFPFPINGSAAKTRVARTSFYIEVEAPISGPQRPGGFTFQRFPMIKEGTTPTIWNIPYAKLDSMPILDFEDPKRFGWLKSFLGLMYTGVERAETDNSKRTVLSNIKGTISEMLYHIAGIKERSDWMHLVDPEGAGTYTIMFVDKLRLDPGSQTVIIDAFVLPLTYPVVDKVKVRLADRGDPPIKIATDSLEADVWAYLLPIFAERCRTWKHTANCGYISGNIPLSTKPEDDPLCSCGRGKGISFPEKWKQWRQFSSLFTRIAISPLFPPNVFDSIDLRKPFPKSTKPETNDPPPVFSTRCAACDGPGKPKLLNCGACKQVKYCSNECKNSHWKTHKAQCKILRAKKATG